MALKRKLTAAEHGALADVLKTEYKLVGTEYILDTDEATELENALTRQKEAARLEKERADRLQAEADAAAQALIDAQAEAARKKGDVTAIEASWQTKLDAAVSAGKAAVEAVNNKLRTLLVDNVAIALAAEISTAPKLILPHIRAMLTADLDGDEPRTRVIGSDGKPSAKTIAELKADLIANDEFSAIIIGSKATGGQTERARGGGNPTGKKFSELTETERVALHKEVGPVEFARRRDADKAAA